MEMLKKGFTLIELMIVLVIMGLLAGVGVPAVLNYRTKAQIDSTKANLRALSSAIDAYDLQIGSLPDSLDDLVKRPSKPEVSEKWYGSFLKKAEVPRDAWGKPFTYQQTPGAEQPYELYSKGKDGKSKITG